MQILLDHITSTVIAGIVFIILMTLQWRVNETTIERTILYMGKKNTLNLGEIIERDVENAGFNIFPGEDGIITHQNTNYGDDTYTSLLEFVSADEDGNQIKVKYTISLLDSLVINGNPLPLLSLLREEDSGSGYTVAGGSAARLTDFDVDLLSTQNVGATRTDARKLRVRFKTALLPQKLTDDVTVRNQHGIDELIWGMTIEPPGLKMQGFQG
ncbi:MAG: hypothetical protein HKN43_08680 [Rhodothermales bacterium]|nr:hypothetical protein [Rhodothermales bacterium]